MPLRTAGRPEACILLAVFASAAVAIAYAGRGTTFWFDEWTWAMTRRGSTLATYLKPFNQHLSLIPIAAYKAMFATVGLHHYWPYRLIGLGGHLLVGALVFVYARRRIGGSLALLVTAPVLFLGSGAQNILWPFQIGWTVPIAAGIAAMLVLDRPGPRRDAGACGLIAVCLASSGVGIAFAASASVRVAASRPRKSWWIAALPLTLYVAWWSAYGRSEGAGLLQALPYVPTWIVLAAGGAVGGVLGLGASSVPNETTTVPMTIVPLALVAAVAAGWRLVPVRNARIVSLLVGALIFWITTGASRIFLGEVAALSSRYVYVGAIFVTLLVVEGVAGCRLPRMARPLLTMAVVAATALNIVELEDFGDYLRHETAATRATLAAIDLSRPAVTPDFVSRTMPGYPFVELVAGRYERASAALGTPAATETELKTMPAEVRRLVDPEMLRMHRVVLAPPTALEKRAPEVIRATGGVAVRGACASLPLEQPAVAGGTPSLDVRLPAGGLTVSSRDDPVQIQARRFADTWSSLGAVNAGATAGFRISADTARQPWQVRVIGRGAAVCRQRP